MQILSLLIIVLVVAVLIGINALYVAGEFATVSAPRPRLAQMARKGNPLAQMLVPVVKDPRRLDSFIAASQVGITLSSIILGIYGEQAIAPLIAPWFSGIVGEVAAAGTAAIIVLLILTFLQVILGELLPKSIAIQYPIQMALLTALPMKWSADILLKPLIALLNGSGRLFLRLLRVAPGGEHAHIHSPTEIVLLVQESHKSGLLDDQEERMLNNVFNLKKTTAGEIVVPRKRMMAFEVNQPLPAILERIATSSFSRIPIYEEDIDNIIGFVHLRDVFSLIQRDPGASVREVLRPVPFLPETVSVTQVWNEMNRADSYLVIVFDEFGGTAGMITREDVFEELFGEFQDEFDREPALVRRQSDGRMVVRGEMPITTLNRLLRTDLSTENYYTVTGLIEDALGRIPMAGDKITEQGILFEVESVSGNTIMEVSIILPKHIKPGAIEPEGAG